MNASAGWVTAPVLISVGKEPLKDEESQHQEIICHTPAGAEANQRLKRRALFRPARNHLSPEDAALFRH